MARLLSVLILATGVWQARTPPAQRSAAAMPSPSAQEQIRILEAQLKLIGDYQDRLLSTVHWSLGVTATMVALLVGFSWFINLRVYGRDKQALAQELRTHIDAVLATARDDISAHAANTAMAAAERGVAEVHRDLETLKRELRNAQMELLTAEADSWRQQEIYSNELLTRSEILDVVLQSGRPWRIGEVLDQISATLNDIVTGKIETTVTSTTVRALGISLDKLPPDFALNVKRITDLLSRVPQG